MTAPQARPATCHGCVHYRRRFRISRPTTWCARYQQVRDTSCIDYKTKRSAIRAALNFWRASLK